MASVLNESDGSVSDLFVDRKEDFHAMVTDNKELTFCIK